MRVKKNFEIDLSSILHDVFYNFFFLNLMHIVKIISLYSRYWQYDFHKEIFEYKKKIVLLAHFLLHSE